MDPRMMRLFLFFCFAVFFFSGCSKDVERKTKVQAGKGASARDQRKLVSDPIAKEIAEASFMLQETGSIFAQVYKVLSQAESGENSLNAFQALRKNLISEYTDDGQLKSELGKAKEKKCALRYTDKGGKREYSIYEAHRNVCDPKASVQRWARLGQEKAGLWYLVIDDQTLLARHGLGRLAHSLVDQGLQTHCRIELSSEKKEISRFKCSNFSQDVKAPNEIRATQALLISSLAYSRDQKARTVVTGTLYDLSQLPVKVKETFQMKEVPVDNQVVIDIKPEGKDLDPSQGQTPSADEASVPDADVNSSPVADPTATPTTPSTTPSTTDSKTPSEADAKTSSAADPATGSEDSQSPAEDTKVHGSENPTEAADPKMDSVDLVDLEAPPMDR